MAILFGPANLKTVRATEWNDDIALTDKSTGAAVPLTGITGMIMRIRADRGDANPPIMELSIANGRLIVVSGAGGILGIRVNTATSRSSFPANDNETARYVYDSLIERTSGAYEPGCSGVVIVYPQITRPLDT